MNGRLLPFTLCLFALVPVGCGRIEIGPLDPPARDDASARALLRECLSRVRVSDVASHELESSGTQGRSEISLLLVLRVERIEGIEAHYLATLREESVDQGGTEEARRARHERNGRALVTPHGRGP